MLVTAARALRPGSSSESDDRPVERQRHDLRCAARGQSGPDDHRRRRNKSAGETASRPPMISPPERAVRLFGARLMDASRSDSPAWPFPYEEFEAYYRRAEALFRVRGELGDDPTEPYHSAPYPYPAIPDEPALADVRARLQSLGLHPSALPLGVDRDAWLAHAKIPWDCYPDCPSSDDLRHIAGFRKGGSGSSVVEVMRRAVDAANDGLRLSGA